MTETLADRAARYFGLYDKPRRSVQLGRAVVGIFTNDRLYVYDEAAYPNMMLSIRLTARRRDALIEELERLRDRQPRAVGVAMRWPPCWNCGQAVMVVQAGRLTCPACGYTVAETPRKRGRTDG